VPPAELPDLAHERVPVHARHRNVAHQHVGRLVLERLERVGSAADRDHLRAAVREHRSNVAGVGVVIDEPDAKAVARRLRLERLTVRIERSWFGYRTTCDTPSVPVCRAVALRTRALA